MQKLERTWRESPLRYEIYVADCEQVPDRSVKHGKKGSCNVAQQARVNHGVLKKLRKVRKHERTKGYGNLH